MNQMNSSGTLLGLGNIYRSQERYSDAVAYFEWLLAIYEKVFSVDDVNIADATMGLGLVYDDC